MPALKEVGAKAPQLKASPRVNPKIGAVADFLKYLKSPKSSQQMQGLMSVLPFVDDLETTLDRVSYGEPLTIGQGMTTALRPEAKGMVELATIFAPGGRAASQAAESGAMALGRVGEQYAERKVPEIMAQGGRPAQLLSDLAKGTISPATVFHGSPHKFTKFDSSKIGTGEGAQVYGHGLYLAENPAVAKEYSKLDPVGGPIPSPLRFISGQEVQPGTGAYKAASLLDTMTLPQARKMVDGWMKDARPDQVEYFQEVASTLASIPKKSEVKQAKPGGNLYQVDLPDEQIAKMLDYDKPLSKQPEYIKQQLLDLIEYEGLPEYLRKDIVEDRGLNTGQRVYEELVKTLGSDKAASEALRQASIPGIRYLDEGSRGVGKGTSNFVVFPGMEDTLRIEKINDSPLDLFLQNYKP
jgi:hypothetical protein